MDNGNIVIETPVKGQWAIMNPPGHAELAFDFLAVNDRLAGTFPHEKGDPDA